jgi:carboxyl-terminal processing protease
MKRTKATAARISLAIVLATSIVASGLLAVGVWADPVAPSDSDRQVALAVTSLLRRDHLLRHPLDDEISRRCLDSFLEHLDPMKVYFYQSDVDSFRRKQDELDDLARRGDVSFAYTVFNTFLRRVDERVKLVDHFLSVPHDFTVDEELVIDRDAAEYARNEAEAREKWRKRIKYDLLVLKADDIEGEEATEKLSRRYHSFAKRMHQTNGEELLEMYLSSLTSSFDPHTTYMSPSTLENFEIAMKLELEGIGAALRSTDGYTVVHKIIPGGAADKDGRLQVKDKIVGVGQGTDGEMVDVVDMKLSEVVKLIRGKRGTVVRLQVISVDSPDRKVIDITRDRIELKDSEAHGEVFEKGQKPDGSPYKLGVIELPSFYMDMAGARRGLPDFKSTTRDVRRILDGFDEQGVDAVILDLRRNGGGSLTEAINLTGLFIDQGPVVQVKDADGRIQPYHDLESGVAWSGPLVVLVSKFSASASEILAGAIQDYRRGLVVGDHATHGKGTVQSLMDLGQQLFRIPNAPKLGALKITMQQFYRPSGASTQNRGVVADVELPSLTTHLDVSESDLDYPVAFDEVEPLEFEKLGYVNEAICDRLQTLSEKRIEESEDFQKTLRNIDRYNEQKDREVVSLNEEKFMAEREELDADKEEEKQLEEMSESDSTKIEEDYYLDEAFALTLDYLQMMPQVARAD